MIKHLHVNCKSQRFQQRETRLTLISCNDNHLPSFFPVRRMNRASFPNIPLLCQYRNVRACLRKSDDTNIIFGKLRKRFTFSTYEFFCSALPLHGSLQECSCSQDSYTCQNKAFHLESTRSTASHICYFYICNLESRQE